MKKITLAVFAMVAYAGSVFGQATFSVVAPPFSNATSSLRAPNGTSSQGAMHACFLVKQSELSPMALANITKFGFVLNSGTSSIPTTGNFTVYLQNTNDATYLKGSSFNTALTGMTTVYNSTMAIPVSAGPTTNTLTLSAPFAYTGGGLYVAYNWTSAGPFDATAAVYQCNNTLSPGGGASEAASGSAPDALTATAFRPSYIFEATNTATTELSVVDATALGKAAKSLAAPQIITARILNSSIGTQSNIAVTLNITGANSFSNVQTISSLAPGTSTVVSFAPYNPTAEGLSGIIISLGPDQILTNNSTARSQSVTCSTMANNPPVGSYTNGVGFNTGSGIVCNKIVPPVNADLRGLRLGISSDAASVGNSIYGVLVSSAGVVLATTNTNVIGSTQSSTFIDVTFPTVQNLTAGTDYYIGLAQTAGTTGYFPVGGLTNSFIPPNYFTCPIAGGSLTPIGNLSYYYGLEAVFTSTNPVITVTPSRSVSCKGEAVVLTASGASSYVWFNNANTASVSVSPTVTTGYAVTGTDANGCVNSKTYSQTVVPCLGLTANSNDGSEIKLFPNPAVNGKTNISGLEGSNTVSVYNIVGQLISTVNTTESSLEIDLDNQPLGNYLVKITNNFGQTKTLKVVH